MAGFPLNWLTWIDGLLILLWILPIGMWIQSLWTGTTQQLTSSHLTWYFWLVLKNCCGLYVSEHSFVLLIDATQCSFLVSGSLRSENDLLSTYGNYFRPLPQYRFLTHLSMLKHNRAYLGRVQSQFTRLLFGWSVDLSYKQSCMALKCYLFWPCKRKLNLLVLSQSHPEATFLWPPLCFWFNSVHPLLYWSVTIRISAARFASVYYHSALFLLGYGTLSLNFSLQASGQFKALVDGYFTVNRVL